MYNAKLLKLSSAKPQPMGLVQYVPQISEEVSQKTAEKLYNVANITVLDPKNHKQPLK